MRPRRYDEVVIQQVQELAVARETQGRSASYVARLARQQIKGAPGRSKTIALVMDARRGARPVPPDVPLVPWDNDWPQNPVDVAVLFRLLDVRALALAVRADLRALLPDLTVRSAHWAILLHRLFDLASPTHGVHLLVLAQLYAERERVAQVLGYERPRTDDLDLQLRMRPWESDERQRAYGSARQKSEAPGRFAEQVEAIAKASPLAARDVMVRALEAILISMTTEQQATDEADRDAERRLQRRLIEYLNETVTSPHGQAVATSLTSELDEILRRQQEDGS